MYVPVQICAYVLKYKLVNEFKLYLLLKYYSKNGILKITKCEKIKISKKLNCCEKTVTNNLKKLLALFWINKNNEDIYFIRAYHSITTQVNKHDEIIYHNTRVEFSFSYFNKFRAYLAGAVLGYFLLKQKNKLWKERRKKARLKQTFPKYLPLSLNALIKITGMKKSTLQSLRTLAVKSFFLKYKSGLKKAKHIHISQVNNYKKSHPENADKVRVINDEVFIQNTNYYSSLLHYKKGRKKTVPY